ncbi:MAG: molybdopterin-dependent oxidoreductase, partial [Janthinobacterium lividum]
RAAAVAHGVLGLGLVVLTPWKVVVARRAPRLTPASLGLAAVVVVCLVAGVVEVLVGPGVGRGLTPIQVHVGAAFLIVAFGVEHVWRHWRPRLARATDLGRRKLLRTAAFGAGAAATFVAVEAVGQVSGSRPARAATGSHPIRPEDVPATIWLLDRVPQLDRATFRVTVGDSALSAADLDARGQAVPARLDCTTGWYADATWTGVPLADLIAVAPGSDARSVLVTSVTGYHRRFELDGLPRLFLATRFQGSLLSVGRGAPVRLVAPGHRGFWWVKWVASVELSPHPASAQSPFPLQ